MKHSVENHFRPCGCRSVGECDHNTFAWMRALDALVDDFAQAMKEKLYKKHLEGRSGWDDPAWETYKIRDALIDHAGVRITTRGTTLLDPDAQDPVDIANFAAFWWNRLQEAE